MGQERLTYFYMGATGLMQASKIGGGNVTDAASEAGGNAYHARRTSFNMLCDPQVLAGHPKLEKHISDMQVCVCVLHTSDSR